MDDRLCNNYLRIGPIFLLGYIVVHFFLYFAYLASEIDGIIGIDYADYNLINSAAICSLLALIAFVIGYINTINGFKISKSFRCLPNIPMIEKIMIFSFLIFIATIDKRYFQGGYGEILNEGGGLSVITILSQQIFIATIIANVIGKVVIYKNVTIKQYVKLFSWSFYLFASIYSLLVILSGDRGPLIQVGLSYFSGYALINNLKYGLKKVLPLVIVGALALNILGSVRNDGGLGSNDYASTSSLLEERFSESNIIFSSTRELYVVVRTHHAIFSETVKHGTLQGLGFFDQLLGIIPGLRPYIVYPIFNYDKGSRSIDTNVLSTNLLNADHGMGTTCCADIFYNFGIIGTFIVFLIFGILIKKLDLELSSPNKKNILYISFAVNYLLLAIYLGRGKLLSPLNISIYSFLLLYCFSKGKTKCLDLE